MKTIYYSVLLTAFTTLCLGLSIFLIDTKGWTALLTFYALAFPLCAFQGVVAWDAHEQVRHYSYVKASNVFKQWKVLYFTNLGVLAGWIVYLGYSSYTGVGG